MNKPLTQARLKEVLDYDPVTGVFVRRIDRAKGTFKAGQIAGSLNSEGYQQIFIDYINYSGHRLAWLYVYGCWPKQLDHINTIRDDNRIDNLREATHTQNQGNVRLSVRNTSGFKGVSWHKPKRKWVAYITINMKPKRLGGYNTKEEAHVAYCKAAEQHFGTFARSE